MKLTKRLFSLAAVALLTTASAQAQTALDDILKSKTLKVAVPTDSATEIRRAAFECLGRLSLTRKIRLLGVRAGELSRPRFK